MRAVIQRVTNASVSFAGSGERAIGRGLVVLLAVGNADTPDDARWLCEKIIDLRVFPNGSGKCDRSLRDIGGALLVVSQFTLYGDCRRGRRPDFSHAAPPEAARCLYDQFIAQARDIIPVVHTGEFAADMRLTLCNDGPLTLIIDTAGEQSP